MEKVGSNLLGKTVDKNVIVKRPNNNDCWNVALALGCNKTYEDVRKWFIKRDGFTLGGGKMSIIKQYLNQYGYVRIYDRYKTLQSLASDTEFTNYEYLMVSRNHMVYIRHGVIYDSNLKNLIRCSQVYKRKISSRRKSLYDFTKEVR